MNASDAKIELAAIAARLIEISESLSDEVIVAGGLSPEIEERVEAFGGSHICLLCEVEITKKDKSTRGVHGSCYAALRRAWAQGLTTEAEDIAKGRIRKAGKGGRRTNAAIQAYLDDAKTEALKEHAKQIDREAKVKRTRKRRSSRRKPSSHKS